MKASELITRQDRVIYVLMLLLASVGLLWSFWQRQHQSEAAVARPQQQVAGQAAHQATFIKR